MRGFVPNALATVPSLVIALDAADSPCAFMGVDCTKIEMLFAAPEVFGQGLGRRLVEYGFSALGVTAVDVNEENPAARGFYEHMGFRVVGRSEHDGQGVPHPILHMRVEVSHAESDDTHAEPLSPQSCLGPGSPVSETSEPLPSADSASLRDQTVRTNGTDIAHAEPREPHAEPQSSQSFRDAGKPVSEVSTSSPSTPLREPISPCPENT